MPDDDQDWTTCSPGQAWHLIDRHATSWKEVDEMMEKWARAWVAANPAKPELDDADK
ncbi:hypothetical protein [Bordetella genomosp. 9]|uniref:hypothetical protein n=1 Tax=Bordetella genomosp. 9 TaxID=1416803 RepID=UPI0012FBBC4D|nr:hypothetical protein [Bordetella genomosp. 9]